MTQITGLTPLPDSLIPKTTPAMTTSGTLRAPLYVAWQVTNECNLACLHCIEESGPGKAFKDELSKEQTFEVLRQIVDNDVPYLSLSGGEPMLHPHFFEMLEYACNRGTQVKVETNGHYLSPENCARLKDLAVKAVQVSLDGATAATFGKMRVRGSFDQVMEGLRNLHAAGVPIEINHSPTGFNVHEIAAMVDLCADAGAESFYTGRTMYTGNAVKTWAKLNATDDQYEAFFDTLREKAVQYDGRMRVHFHEMGLLDELRYRLHHPAALLIVLPNGLVKLINALPFVCGDLRTQTLAEVWGNFQHAWQDPRVAAFVDALEQDPEKTSLLHQWINV
nr:radical SAM protein [uncultured Rhodopila sp.]